MTKSNVFGSLEERTSGLTSVPLGSTDMVTRGGVLAKLGGAIAVASASAVVSWSFFNIYAYVGALLAGLVLVFMSSRNPDKANVLLIPYAALEGYVVAGFTQLIFQQYSVGYGVALASVLVVASLFAGCYAAYAAGIIQYNSTFVSATGMLVFAALAFYLLAIVTNLFGQDTLVNFYSGGSIWSIILSGVMVMAAAMTLVTDFMFLREAEGTMLKKHEAYLAMGILISLVWVYIETLRLIAKIYGGRK